MSEEKLAHLSPEKMLSDGHVQFIWKLCGITPDGSIRTFCAELSDGTLFLTRGPLDQVATTYVPDETYIVDDTDYSKVPGGRSARKWATPPPGDPK